MGCFSLRDFGQTVSLTGALDYLSKRGWTTRQDGQAIRCEGPPDDEGNPIVKFLPASETYSDFPLRLEDLVSALSVIEERPAVEIVREMARETVLTEEESRRLNELLRPVLVSAELARSQQTDGLRQTADVARRLARGLPDDRLSVPLFRHLLAVSLAEIGLQLVLSPAQTADLYQLAKSDSPDALKSTCCWLAEQKILQREKPVRSGFSRRHPR